MAAKKPPTPANRPLPLVLASSSPYRQSQLRQLQLPFVARPANIDEARRAGESAPQLASRLASEKAQAVARENKPALVIGGDQTLCVAGEILGKPGGFDAAFAQLRRCSAKIVCFYSALCLHNSLTGEQHRALVTTEVKFRALNDTQIANYLAREQPYDCAGSFKCEGLGIALFDWVRSDDPSALIGLPLISLTRLLADAGIDCLLSPPGEG